MVTLPRNKNGATSGIGTAYAIAADTEYPEAAWLWVIFLSEQIPQSLIPARKSLAESSTFRDQVGAEIADAALQSMQDVTLISPDLLDFQDALGIFNQAIMDIHNGEASAQEALDWAQDQSQ
jgi:ABC-type glycerol-3-phosphate transport system substrate-binding protein